MAIFPIKFFNTEVQIGNLSEVTDDAALIFSTDPESTSQVVASMVEHQPTLSKTYNAASGLTSLPMACGSGLGAPRLHPHRPTMSIGLGS